MMQATLLRLQSARGKAAMRQSMAGLAGTMRAMNRRLQLPKLEAMLKDFEKQSKGLETKQDLADDVMGESSKIKVE